ncbi:hypothetical protein GCM10027049_01250 [Mucilaginibacter puniceus]
MLKRGLLVFSFISIALSSRAQSLPVINLLVSNYKASIRTLDLPLKNADVSINLKGRLFINDDWSYITYYTKFDGEAKQGKIKTINDVVVNYYDKFDGFDNIGKVKSVGNITITYYDRFDNKIQFGKVKSIGGTTITYNDQFDGFDNTGQIKSVGQINITYYDRFSGELNGKLKSVGDIKLTYYDRFSSAEEIGKIKEITGKAPNVHIYRIASNALFDED